MALLFDHAEHRWIITQLGWLPCQGWPWRTRRGAGRRRLAAKRVAASTGYPWALAGLFSAASVEFNVAHAPERAVARLVFAMAPVALVLTTHLLMQQVGWHARHAPPGLIAAPVVTAEPDTPVRPAPADMPVARSGRVSARPGSRFDHARPNPDLDLGTVDHRADTTGPDEGNWAVMPGPRADLQIRAKQVYQEHRAAGRRVSGAAPARQVGTSERHGRRLLAELRANDEGLRPSQRRSTAQAGRSHAQMTNQERECIRDSARRHVREQAPVPPLAILEQVAQVQGRHRPQGFLPEGSPPQAWEFCLKEHETTACS